MTSAMLLLPAALGQPDGSTIGAKGAMGLIALVFVALLALMIVVGNRRAAKNPPKAPQYPILEPPNGRDAPGADRPVR